MAFPLSVIDILHTRGAAARPAGRKATSVSCAGGSGHAGLSCAGWAPFFRLLFVLLRQKPYVSRPSEARAGQRKFTKFMTCRPWIPALAIARRRRA